MLVLNSVLCTEKVILIIKEVSSFHKFILTFMFIVACLSLMFLLTMCWVLLKQHSIIIHLDSAANINN